MSFTESFTKVASHDEDKAAKRGANHGGAVGAIVGATIGNNYSKEMYPHRSHLSKKMKLKDKILTMGALGLLGGTVGYTGGGPAARAMYKMKNKDKS